MNILGVGTATLDIINLVERYPNEDEELRAVSQSIRRGGNAANTLSVLSQFHHDCFWAGTLASDYSAKYIRDDFVKNAINFDNANQLNQGKQPTSYITLNKTNGSRTIVHYRNLSELDFRHFSTIAIKHFDWIHFEARAINETTQMVQQAKSLHPQIKISVEIEKPRVDLQDIFNIADFYFFSKTFANLTGFDNAKKFLVYQNTLSPNADLVCSWGAKGAFAYLKNKQFISSNAYVPNKIIDTIGAGDTFHAALIHSQLAKQSWQTSLDFACMIAGKKCGQFGFENLGMKI